MLCVLRSARSSASTAAAARLRRWSTAVAFHPQTDFDWHDLHRREEHRLVATAPCSAVEVSADSQLAAWQRHFHRHADAPVPFFRERRYLLHQFPLLHQSPLRLLEVGCGNGSSVLPVLRTNAAARVHATDISPAAVALTRAVVERAGLGDRLTTATADADGNLGSPEAAEPFDAALLVFTASAVPGEGDAALLRRVGERLRPGGRVLFRDYGLLDLRHLGDLAAAATAAASTAAGGAPRADACVRLTDRTFRRAGGTFRRYYALEDVARLAEGADLALSAARYCCVRLRNGRSGLTMERVYVHAEFTKV